MGKSRQSKENSVEEPQRSLRLPAEAFEETLVIDESARFSPSQLVEHKLIQMLRQASPLVSQLLREKVQAAAETGQAETVAGKQALAKEINAECRRYGQVIAHPDTGDPCIVVAINVGTEGRFVLEDSATKKRSHTTKDVTSLPLETKPIPPDKK